MTTPNPDTSSQTGLADARRARIELPQYTFAALVAMQFLSTLRYSGAYFELTNNGVVSFVALFVAVPASICLYVAAIFLLLKGSGGKRLFLLAAAGLAVTVPFWRWPTILSVVAAFGATLGVAGWWFARLSPSTTRPRESHTAMPGLRWFQRRPIPVFIISIVCTLSFVGFALFVSRNWTGFEQLMHDAPIKLVTFALYPLLLLSGGWLLLFMREEAIILFILYFVWGLGKTISENVPFLIYPELALVFAVIVYCLHLRKRNLLR